MVSDGKHHCGSVADAVCVCHVVCVNGGWSGWWWVWHGVVNTQHALVCVVHVACVCVAVVHAPSPVCV